jgi:hypothetical protein
MSRTKTSRATGLATSAVLAVSLLTLTVEQAVPTSLASPPRVAAAPTEEPLAAPLDGCLNDFGDPVVCDFGLEPIQLPVGRTIGEYELGVLARTTDGQPVLHPRDFAAGDDIGGCVPEQEACQLVDQIRVGEIAPDESPDDYYLYENARTVSSSPTTGALTLPSKSGDMAVTKADLTGDGREDVVVAAMCSLASVNDGQEICLSFYNPASNTYSQWQRTGLDLDSGHAPIRLAAGNIAQTTSRVVGATFRVADDGIGLIARFTTAEPHDLRPGQALRFDLNEAWLLNEALCVTDGEGSTNCAGAFGEDFQPVQSVSADRRAFTVRVGSLTNGDPTADCPEGFRCLPDGGLEPVDWPQPGCEDGCSVAVLGTGPGIAVSYAAPGGSGQLAAVNVRPGLDRPFRVADVHALGGLTGARKAHAVAVGDLDGGAPDEIAAVLASRCAADPCAQLRIFRLNDSRQLVQLRASRLPTVSVAEINGQGVTESIDLAVGQMDTRDTGNGEGADLLVGWAKAQAACLGNPCAGQEYVVLDISPRFISTVAAQGVLESTPNPALVVRTMVKVEAADLDGDGLDDPVIARTWPFGSDARMTVNAFGSSAGAANLTNNTRLAVGAGSSGQLDLAVGQVGRLDDPDSVSVPNGVNPDIILGWTCNSVATCGTAAAGPSVAVQAFGVTAQQGSMAISSPSSAPPVVTPAQIGPTAAYGVANERSYVNLGLADLDADSETLGAPVTYLTVGEVRPMLILRSPPVHYDVLDGSGTDGRVDGLISYNDTDDVNQCFALNLNCTFGTTYDTVSTIASSVSGSLTNSWGIGGAVTTNAWWGKQKKDPKTDEVKCDDPVCAGLSVKLAVEYEAQQEDQAKAGRTFTYSSTREVGPASDAAFVLVQTTETIEWPVYPGVSAFGSGLEPGRFVRVDSPAETRFQWISATDPELSASWWQSTVPGNMLSYPRTPGQVPADTRGVSEVSQESQNTLLVTTSGSHGFVCNLADFTVPDGERELQPPAYLTDYPCGTANVPITLSGLTGPGAKYNGNYLAVEVQGSLDLLVRRVTGDVPAGEWQAGDVEDTNCPGCPRGTLRRIPGAFLDEDILVARNRGFRDSIEVTDESEFNASAAWSIDASIETNVSVSGEAFAAGAGVNVELRGHYKRAETASRTVQATSGTTFTVSIGRSTKSGNDFWVKPYLASDPTTKAMVLDWTADCRTNCTGGVWAGYRSKVDLAFALPRLLDPYRDPNNSGYDLTNLLRSPDFQTWRCGVNAEISTTVCRPEPAATTGRPLTLSTFVHNYSLKPFVSNRPAIVRYFVGDPARGGYLVAEGRMPRVTAGAPAVCAGFGFCIPARDETIVTTNWTPPPGLSGQGSADRPLAIYGVIAPPQGTPEVHPFTGAVDLARCAATYPYIDNLHSEYYDPNDTSKDRLSRCPTNNNEGFFLQRFADEPARSSDLSVRADGVRVSPDGKTLNVEVRSSRALSADRVEVRAWACARTAACTPVSLPMPNNASAAQGLRVTKLMTAAAGGVSTVKLPVNLPAGTRKVTVQVVSVDTWERPGGPGVSHAGQLANNVVTKLVTVG